MVEQMLKWLKKKKMKKKRPNEEKFQMQEQLPTQASIHLLSAFQIF